MKKNYLFSFIGLVVLILLILAIVLPGKNKKQEIEVEEVTSFQTPETFVGEDNMAYSFSGIDWSLESVETDSVDVPKTRIGFFFENFTRYEGALPAVFNKPFHLGFYTGECTNLETLSEDEDFTSIEGKIISGVKCTWGEESSLVVLAQNKNLVTAYNIVNKEVDAIAVREIDITTIVR